MRTIAAILTIAQQLFLSVFVSSQNDWKKQFPEADAIYTNISCNIEIKMQDGKWIATSDFSEDLLYLTDNSVMSMNRGYIYHTNFNELKKWDAYTRVTDNKKLKVTNTKTNSSREDYIFYDDVKSTTFEFSGATIGATRHIEYQIQHNDLYLLNPFYFDRYFPVAQAELRITFPSDIKIKYLFKGLHSDNIKFTEVTKRNRTTYIFQISGLKGVQRYADSPDNSYYSTHVIFYIEQIKENDQWKNFLSSPDDLYNHYYQYVKNINQTISPELKEIVDSIKVSSNSDEEIARKIYKWVQNNIKYVAFESGMEGFIPREANLVYSRRFGDCKDMASILTSMMKYAGIPSYLTWIGTRHIPYDYTDVPLPIVDNHMICTINLNGKLIFLDGTDGACLFNTPPYSIQGKQAMIGIGENKYQIIRVPIAKKENNITIDSTFMEVTEKGIAGHIKVELSGYFATTLREILNYKNEKEKDDYLKERFSRGSNKISFTNWKIVQDSDRNIVTADFILEGYAKKLGNEWYLNMNLIKLYEHEEIDFPKREIPIEFKFLEHSSFVTALKIPDGFKISYLPKSTKYNNKTWGFNLQYSSTNGYVYLNQEFDNDYLMLEPDRFEEWNKVLENLFPNYKETISLSKN
jgi:hypothetical protein